MSKNTSISLGDHFESFIEHHLAEGRFKNASEVIRAGLRLLEEDESRLLVLKNAIQEGISSRIVQNFDPNKHLEILKERKKQMANFLTNPPMN